MIGLLGPPPQELLDRADSATLSSLYTAEGVYDFASDDDDAHETLVIFADYQSSSQVNSNIQNSFPQRLLPFRT